MTALDPRLGEIEARLAEATTCKSYCGSDQCQTERDVAYLLSELRKAREALVVTREAAFADSAEAALKGLNMFAGIDAIGFMEGFAEAARKDATRAAIAAATGGGE